MWAGLPLYDFKARGCTDSVSDVSPWAQPDIFAAPSPLAVLSALVGVRKLLASPI